MSRDSNRCNRLGRSLGLVMFAASLGTAFGQDPPASPTIRGAEVRDAASMFSTAAVSAAEALLDRSARAASLPAVIETVKALEGEPIESVSLKNAMRSGREGLYVLLAREEKRIEVRVSKRFKTVVDLDAQRTIRDAFISGLKEGDPDAGLRRGSAAIARVLDSVKVAANASSRDDPRDPTAGGASSLVVRNQVRLTLAGARRIVEGAERKAVEMGLKVNIAVVDDGGHMLNFARMDGARPASGYTATTKAVTAATFRQETGPLPKGTTAPDPLLNLSLQNAAAASGGKVTTLLGGIPVIVEGQVIGAAGVGGGTGEQDATIARAGIEAFVDGLKAERPAVQEKPAHAP